MDRPAPTNGDQAAPALEFQDFRLAHRHRGVELLLLENVTLTVPRGGLYLLVGESGAGKSSLLRLITGLSEPREVPPRVDGVLSVLGNSVVDRYPVTLRGRVAAIMQDEGLLDELSPRGNVELALRAAGASRKLAPGLLAQVGLDNAPPRVALLSGGMRKRLAMARALAGRPDLLLCDEPTAGLDPEAARELAALLRDSMQRAGRQSTTIVITHDVRAFEGICDGLIILDRAQRSLALHEPDTEWMPSSGRWERSSEPDADALALHGIRRGLLEAAGVADTLGQSLLRLPPVELRQVVQTTVRYQLEPIAFVALAAAVIGGLATFFALRNNPIEGAFEGQVLTGSGKVLTAVLVPLLAGFFFTARMAAGAAARLGTMKRNHQVSALSMMGIEPADYLLTPLIWAMTLAMPVITAAGCVAAALASLVAAKLVTGVSTFGWASAYFMTVDGTDLKLIMLKGLVSGYLVAVVTYHLATGPKRSGRDVGDAVNASIVLGMAVVLAVHSAITFWHYA